MTSWLRFAGAVCLVQLCLGMAAGGALAAPTTTATPAGGLFNAAQNVTLSCTDASGPGCGNTYYSTDGNAPGGTITIVDAAYGAPFNYDPVTHTFTRNTAQCTASANSKTVVQSACNGNQSCSVAVGAGTFGDPCVGTFKHLYVVYQCNGQYLFVSADDYTNANLACYGAQYSGPISIGTNTTLKFFSRDLGGGSESLRTETYTFDFNAPSTTPSLAGGYYATPQTVTLACADSGAGCQATYYCFGAGCTPATAYAGAGLGMSALALLRYYSVDGAGNAEAVKQTDYLIASPASLSLAPASLDAGSLPVGAAGVAQAVVLTNPGGAALTTPGIPATAGDFAVSHDCPASLAAGTQCSLGIVFSPTQAGVRDVVLAIGGQNVNLAGKGTLAADSILVDPDNASILYAGLDGGGVFVSADGGAHWTAATAQPANKRIKALAKRSAAPLYAGSRGGGVYKAASGTAFAACGAQPANAHVLSLLLDAAGKLYAGTEGGVFVSADGCASWTAINTGLP